MSEMSSLMVLFEEKAKEVYNVLEEYASFVLVCVPTNEKLDLNNSVGVVASFDYDGYNYQLVKKVRLVYLVLHLRPVFPPLDYYYYYYYLCMFIELS